MKTCTTAWAKALKPVEWYRCLTCHRCFEFVEKIEAHLIKCGRESPEVSSKDSGIGTDEEAFVDNTTIQIKQEPKDLDATEPEINLENIPTTPSKDYPLFTPKQDCFDDLDCNLENKNCDSSDSLTDELNSDLNLPKALDITEPNNLCYFCSVPLEPKHRCEHIRVHTNENPFQCNRCGKEFRRRSNQQLHSQKCCPSKSPFQPEKIGYLCYFCNQPFFHINTLRTHLRLHTGEKYFSM